MRIPLRFLGALVAVISMLGLGLQSAHADSGKITLTVYKAGWVIGGSGGSGRLTFKGRSYRLGVGGIVSNIRRASDVEGVYGAAGAGLAVGRGVRAIILTNQNGAVLELSGRQSGLMVNVDLSGLALTIK